MNLKEQLTEAKAELLELKEAVKSEDETAMARARELMDEVIPGLQADIEKAEKAAEIIAQIGEPAEAQETEEEKEMEEYKSIGEAAVKSFVGAHEKGTRFSLTTPEIKSAAPMGTVQQVEYDRNVVNVPGYFRISSLFAQETISGNALTFYRLADKTDAVAATAEKGAKGYEDYTTTAVTVALTKIAGYIKESEELLEDAEWLANGMEDRLLSHLYRVENAQVLTGNGTAPNMAGVLNTSGIGSVTYTHGGTVSPDDVFKAIMKVKADTDLDADAIIINPADYQAFRLSKDLGGQYYGGGFFYGPYGNGSLAQVPSLWGIPTYLSSNVTAGNILVGAFKQGGSFISKGGIRVEATNSDQDDFIKNLVTVRAEERAALAIRIPAAFVLVSEAAS